MLPNLYESWIAAVVCHEIYLHLLTALWAVLDTLSHNLEGSSAVPTPSRFNLRMQTQNFFLVERIITHTFSAYIRINFVVLSAFTML